MSVVTAVLLLAASLVLCQCSTVGDLERKVEALEVAVRQLQNNDKVGFYARLPSDTVYSYGQTVKFSNVITSLGNNYNPATGIFSAPRNGTYVFLLSVGSVGGGFHAQADLMVDSVAVAHVFAGDPSGHPFRSGSCSAVVNLSKNQHVWVKANHRTRNMTFWQWVSSFSGFLLA